MYCSNCGKQIADDAAYCSGCGAAQKKDPRIVQADPGCGVFIPPNTSALWAYYLGIFSLVCGLLALPAFIMGICGVRYANRHPEARGKVHAWVGIILGGIWTLLWTALTVVLLFGIITNH